MADSVWARKRSRWTISSVRTPAHTSSDPKPAAWMRCRASEATSSATATIHERRWPLRMPRESMIMPMPAERGQRAGGLHDGDRQVGRNEVEVHPQGGRHRREQVDCTGHEQRHGGEAPDPSHADPVRRHLGRGRPRRPRRPSGRHLGVDVGRLGAALDHDVGGDEPLAHGRHRQVSLGEEQADVQVRPRLNLEGRLLTVVQERRREPQPTPVLVHHLGGGARAGEESGVEMRELGDERPTGDDARRAALDRGAGGVQRVLPVDLELGMGDGADTRRAGGPGGGQPFAAECPPDAARGDGHHEGQHREQGDRDDQCHEETGEPRGGVRALQRVLLTGRAEDAAERVDHEVDAQQERDRGEQQGGGPQVAAQPAVEQARGDEAPRQPRVVEALHARQPGSVLGRRGVDGRAGVSVHGAGPHQHRPGARPRLAGEVDRIAHHGTTALQRLPEFGVVLGGGHHDDDL